MPLPWEFMREIGTFRWFCRTGVRQFNKRILRRDQNFRLPTGLTVLLPRESKFGSEVYLTCGHVDWGSEELLAAFLKQQKEKSCILDIGANIGYYSLYLSPLASRVYAFEPDPRALIALRRNASRGGNIEVHECALGAVRGTTSFALGDSSEVSYVLNSDERIPAIQVKIDSVDNFVASTGIQVSCLKIDTEGHELQVFEGARNTLTSHRPIVLAESNPDETLFGLMQSLSYNVFAYVRSAPLRLDFCQLLPGAEVHGRTKMLFLVPSEKAETLAKCAKA